MTDGTVKILIIFPQNPKLLLLLLCQSLVDVVLFSTENVNALKSTIYLWYALPQQIKWSALHFKKRMDNPVGA